MLHLHNSFRREGNQKHAAYQDVCLYLAPGGHFTGDFYSKFKFDGNFALLYLNDWPADRNKCLHMPREHMSCHLRN